jgi:hypothetical protein
MIDEILRAACAPLNVLVRDFRSNALRHVLNFISLCPAEHPLVKPKAGQGSRPLLNSDNLLTITPRGENKLRTRATEDKFSVAVDCATLQNTIDYSL